MTFNVRTLSILNQLAEVKVFAANHKIDIYLIDYHHSKLENILRYW